MEEYIKCSRCRRKFINDEEHIATDFGYTRWNTRFKNCVDCRNYGKKRTDTTTPVRCEYCGSRIMKKQIPPHLESQKCKTIKEIRTQQIIDKLPELPDNVIDKIWEILK